MKITDTRDQTTFRGTLVTTIEAGREPTKEELKEFYGVHPSDRNYSIFQQPQDRPRVVLRRGEAGPHDEPTYFIIPLHDHYKVEMQRA